MRKTKQSLFAALAFALLLAFASPVRSQEDTTQPAGSDEMQAPSSSEVESAPDETKAPAATHHTAKKKKHPTHHKHTKKKPAHKTAKKHHAKKPVKKAHVIHHHKAPAKKAAKPKEVRQEPPAPVKEEAEDNKPIPLAPVQTEAHEHAKRAPKSAAVPVPAAHKEKALANGATKSVTYTFCLGYDNCVPYRYEAMMHGGSVDAKVFKETAERDWSESKIDPVMAEDLNTMARTESGSDVSRPLTVTEKARIADHQGKVHVDLVAAANDGRKEEVKQTLRTLGIKNADELQTYDARLAKNDTAVSAANELATGH